MVYLIAAQASNRVIGNKGQIPWQLSTDVEYFRQHIKSRVVLMGRRVYDSFANVTQIAQRAIVITSNNDGIPSDIVTVGTMEEAIKVAGGEDLYVIGGGQTYASALPFADGIYLTEIDHEYEGDVFFPVLDPAEWQKTLSTEGHEDNFGYRFFFNYYSRKSRAA